MPRGDRTGPNGFGPMTGRRLGYCAGYDSPGFTRGYGMGWGGGRHGYGMGYGRGFGYGAYPGYIPPAPAVPYSKEQETGVLKSQAEALQNQLKAVMDRLDQLTKSSDQNE